MFNTCVVELDRLNIVGYLNLDLELLLKINLFAVGEKLRLLSIAVAVVFAVSGNRVSAGMELQRVDGTVVDLDEYRGDGQWLLVMFWAVNCHICEEQKPEISLFHEKHRNDDAKVLGVALDGMDKIDLIKSNIERHKTSFPSLVGNIAIVASHYKNLTEESLRGTPTYLLFNPEGELVGNNPGPLRIQALEEFIASKSE
ncbi:hypothetical protein AB833_30655 [Chromatiales bacterium (ex Bugula neritina AB1)]|nr:hypothetical protein AB833_30655 [Chromatiales bacterium (ex Bugula neritina AB1)]